MSEPVTSGEVEDSAALFQRMGLKVDLGDEAAATEAGPEGTSPVAVDEQAIPHDDDTPRESGDASAAEDDDVMVAEYMNRLLGRSKASGVSPLPEYGAATGGSSAINSAQSARSAAGDNNATKDSPKVAARTRRKRRPATAPEPIIDMTAMRELANLSAHGAINTHSRKYLAQATFTKLLLVVLSLVAGVAMAWNASTPGGYGWIGAGVCWTITVVWGTQYLCLAYACYGPGKHRNQGASGYGKADASETAAGNTATGSTASGK